MKKKLIWIFFSISAFFSLLGFAFMPEIKLFPFTAFIAFIISTSDLKKAICFSFLCGAVLDIFTSEMHFGLYASIYMLATAIMYLQKWIFFHDKFLSIPIYTFVISLLISAFIWTTKFFMGFKTAVTLSMFSREALLMPLLDSLFALLFYSLPLKGLQILRKKGFNFYFLRKLQ